jgi:ComF family protein
MRVFIKKLQKLFRFIINLVFPVYCLICKKQLFYQVNTYLCDTCRKDLVLISGKVCNKCGRPFINGICGICKEKQFYFSKARASGIYDGGVRECIHFFKYKKKTYILNTLFEVFLLPNSLDFLACDLIVPVPLHWIREYSRGFNQAELIGKKISKRFNIPLSKTGLKRTKATPSQTGLSLKERARNIKGAFSVRNSQKLNGKRILLVDDVMTTGATVNECSRVLLQAGAREILVYTLARGR